LFRKCVLASTLTTEHHYTVETNTAIVLGVFFGITFVIAAGGWYLWWRARQSAAYAPL